MISASRRWGARRTWALALAGVAAFASTAAAVGGGRSAGPEGVCDPYQPAPVPAEARPFVEPGRGVLCVVGADLTGDRLRDYVLVLGRVRESLGPPDDRDEDDERRTLLVLAGQPGGGVRLAARSERAVLCASCGGNFDPFTGVSVDAGSITVHHYGGMGWRWRSDYTFRYVPAADRWRLARVEESGFHASEPDKVEAHVYTSPRHFGVIDLAKFDPEQWKDQGRGER